MANTQIIPEAMLVVQLQEKRESAFAYLYDKYSGALYGVIKRNISEETQSTDILQDVFVKIFKNIDKYNAEAGSLFTWMMNIARNASIDFLRSKANHNDQKNRTIEDTAHYLDKNHQVELNINTIDLKKLLDRLPESQAEALAYVYFKGYTQKETSELLDIPLGTIKTRVRLGINSLKEYYKVSQ